LKLGEVWMRVRYGRETLRYEIDASGDRKEELASIGFFLRAQLGLSNEILNSDPDTDAQLTYIAVIAHRTRRQRAKELVQSVFVSVHQLLFGIQCRTHCVLVQNKRRDLLQKCPLKTDVCYCRPIKLTLSASDTLSNEPSSMLATIS
jgi:hypothetical protein